VRTTTRANTALYQSLQALIPGNFSGATGLRGPSSATLGRIQGAPRGQRPGGAGGPQDRKPGAAGKSHMDPDHLGGAVASRTGRAHTAPCRASSRQRTLSGRCTLGPAPRRRANHHSATEARLEDEGDLAWRWMTKSIVPRPSKFRRLILWPGRAAGVGAGGGGGRAGEDRQRAEARKARAAPTRACDRRWRRRRAGPGARARPSAPRARAGARQSRSTAASRISIERSEVAHHPAVVQGTPDGDEAAQHCLRDHSEREQRSQPDEDRAR